MKFSYGLDTTQIIGRLQKPKNGIYNNFYNFFRIDQQKNREHKINLMHFAGGYLEKY
ncbi:MAG: hypothetical protein JKY48_10845 [Flavobacteriales bacterium]|nr:hypothetical protein [Flavobacteriales bacterium]